MTQLPLPMRPPIPMLLRSAVDGLGWLPLAAVTALAMAAADGGTGEATYLALITGLVLLPGLRLLDGLPTLQLALPVLLTTVSWGFASGASRGGVVTLLLVLSLALAVWSRALERRIDTEALVLLALALQFLFHSAQLLDPQTGLRGLALWVLLPLVAAAATAVIKEAYGFAAAGTAAASLIVLAGGITAMAVATLAVVAAAARAPLLAAALAGGALIWDPARGLVLAVGLLVLLGGRLWAAAALVAGATLMLFGEPRPWGDVASGLAWIALLLPAVLVQLANRSRHHLARALAAVLLAVVALRLLPAGEALMVPLALVALAPVRPRSPVSLNQDPVPAAEGLFIRPKIAPPVVPRTLGLSTLGLVWSGVLLAAVALLSSYPWLRSEAAATALAALHLHPDLSSALAVLALTTGLGLWPHLRRAGLLLGAAILLVAFPAADAWRSELLIRWPPVTLTDGAPAWEHAELSGPVGTLVLDTALANAADLRLGTEIARVRLHSAESLAREWSLRVGYETGEWAAGRPGVEGAAAPTPFLHELAEGGTFFSRRYRARLVSHRPLAASRIEIVRSADLPKSVSLTLHTLLRRPRGGR